MLNRKRDLIRDLELALKSKQVTVEVYRRNYDRLAEVARCKNACCRIAKLDDRGKIDTSMMPIAVEPSEAERTVRELAADNERLKSQVQSLVGQRDRANERGNLANKKIQELLARPATTFTIDTTKYATIKENDRTFLVLSANEAADLKAAL